ncbi:transporter [Fluoribacter dumoffii]|uniref:transporter n=1 Tax=Fluoribacter dumoffii TaxID=463 RepID=UPI002244E6AB|nr:transporter [Fluoribacter dumoffii]MCW8386500.1 transporter [Fluoribacter dumoffii]
MKCLFLSLKEIAVSLARISLIGLTTASYAGAPFISDDPLPLKYKQWEVIIFSGLDKNNDLFLEPYLFAPALEINYGPSEDLLLHALVPYAWALPSPAPLASGLGDIELGAKYRFLRETSKLPQIAFAPLLEVPTGSVNKNLGNGIPWGKLPIWAQKSWGKWTTYGGGGYVINTAPGMLNYFYSGWLLQKQLKDQLILGGEVFYQTAITAEGNYSVLLNAGGVYSFNKNFSLLFSARHSIFGQNHLIAYLGLYWTFEKSVFSSTHHEKIEHKLFRNTN